MKKILLGLTTTPGSDWREKIEEIEKFGIDEIALFPTFIKHPERRTLYDLLGKSRIRSIPCIHLRNDFELEEIDYLVDRYNVKALNLHCNPEHIDAFDRYKKYQKMIYFENGHIENPELFEQYLGLSGGMCVDFSHLNDKRVTPKKERKLMYKWMKKYLIGWCHVSAMKRTLLRSRTAHKYSKLSELDYITKYKEYLPQLISLELENSFEEQLEAKKYLSLLLK